MSGRRAAAELLTPAVPRAAEDETVADLLGRLRESPFDEASHVYLVSEDGVLLGQAPIERILAAEPTATLGALRGAGPLRIHPEELAETAALLAVESADGDVAVVDGRGRLLGAIPIGALLAALHDEHVDDFLRLGGVGRATPDPTEPPSLSRSIRARLPWLLIGLVGGSAAAGIVHVFEHTIERQLSLAFFLPLVVYVADAVGTQTETVLVRRLAYGPVALTAQLGREARLGVLLGAAIGGAVLLLLSAFAVPLVIGGIVAASLVVTSIEATLVATLLPIGLARLGADPALASGPIATVLQDLLSVAIYLAIAATVFAIR